MLKPIPTTNLAAFWYGFKYPFKGLKFISQKHLWKNCLPAILVNVLVFASLVTLIVTLGTDLANYVAGLIPSNDNNFLNVLLTIGRYVTLIVILIIQFLLALLLINNCGSILASPFLDLLSEQVEREQKQLVIPPISFKVSLKLSVNNALRGLLASLRTWLLYLPLNLIPGIGSIIYFILNLYTTSHAHALEYLALPLDRRLILYDDEMALIKNNKAICAGFGLAVNLITVIPLVHIVLLPLAAVGGTLLFTDLWLNGKFPEAVADKCQKLTFEDFNNDHS